MVPLKGQEGSPCPRCLLKWMSDKVSGSGGGDTTPSQSYRGGKSLFTSRALSNSATVEWWWFWLPHSPLQWLSIAKLNFLRMYWSSWVSWGFCWIELSSSELLFGRETRRYGEWNFRALKRLPLMIFQKNREDKLILEISRKNWKWGKLNQKSGRPH